MTENISYNVCFIMRYHIISLLKGTIAVPMMGSDKIFWREKINRQINGNIENHFGHFFTWDTMAFNKVESRATASPQ